MYYVGKQRGIRPIPAEWRRGAVIVTPEGMTDTFEEKRRAYFLWHRTTEETVVFHVWRLKRCSCRNTLWSRQFPDGNPWGKDHEYKGLEKDGAAYSYAFHRCAVPGATCSGMKNWELRCSAQAPVQGVCRNQRKVICITVSCGRRKKGRVLYSDCWGPAFQGNNGTFCFLYRVDMHR